MIAIRSAVQMLLWFLFVLTAVLSETMMVKADRDVVIFRPIGTPSKAEVEKELQNEILLEAKNNRMEPILGETVPFAGTEGVTISVIASSQLKLGTFSERGFETVRGWLATLKLNRGDLQCTATLIGPRVLLTAAHCLNGVTDALVHVDVDQGVSVEKLAYNLGHYKFKEINARCEQHNNYRPYGFWRGFDYGLCLLEKDIPNKIWVSEELKEETEDALLKLLGDSCPDLQFNNRYIKPEVIGGSAIVKLDSPSPPQKTLLKICVNPLFENLSLNPKDSSRNILDRRSPYILMSGFGCSDRDQSRPDGNLRADYIKISRDMGYRLRLGHSHDSKSAFLCAGDSGGAAYRVFTEDPFGPRVVIGINSENTIVNNRVGNVSYVVKTTSIGFRRFFRSWMRRNGNPKVCGIDGYSARCRPLAARR